VPVINLSDEQRSRLVVQERGRLKLLIGLAAGEGDRQTSELSH
jgi:hypothetical protein